MTLHPRHLIRSLLVLGSLLPVTTKAQTEIEPNNNSSQATPVTYNTAMSGSIGACNPTDISSDYFELTAPAQGVLRFQVAIANTGPTELPVSFELRSNTSTVIETFTVMAGANSVPNNITLTRTCEGIGTYYVSIPNASSSVCVNYSFTYDVVAPLYTNDTEPNNSSAQALDLAADTQQDGHLDFRYDNDFDYYRIQAPDDGLLNIAVHAEHAGSSTTDSIEVQLRSNSSTVIQIWKVGVGANGVPNAQMLTRTCTGTEQVYFLELYSPDLCGISYQFSYSVAPPVFADDAEPNQSTSQAIVADAGTDYDGRLDFYYDNDFDYYRLQAPDDGILNVTVQAEHAGSSTTDSIEVQLRTNVSTLLQTWKVGVGANGIPNAQMLTRTCTGTEQVYYLEVNSPGLCGVSYRFNYSVSGPVFGDDTEPNQSTSQAIVADAGTDYDGRLDFYYDNDFDYYRLQAPNDGILNVTVQAEHAGSSTTDSIEVQLRTNVSASLQTWKVGVGANGIPNAQILTRTCTGTEQVYYLEVYSPSLCGVSYRFNYSVSGPVFGDDTEPNQSSSQALDIDLNAAPADGRVEFEYDNNVDYYRIDHPGGPIVLYTQAENAGPSGTMQVLIKNSSASLLETAIVPVGGSSVPAANTYTSASYAAGTYYLEVYDPRLAGLLTSSSATMTTTTAPATPSTCVPAVPSPARHATTAMSAPRVMRST